MTDPTAVNSGGPPHESQATLYGMLGNAAGKVPDVALAQLHPRSRGGLPPRVLRRVREYVEAHLEKNISLVMLASTAGLSMSHFARAFKQSQGVPPHEYLVRCRVRRVQELLATTDMPLSEIFGSEPLHAPVPGAGRHHSEQLPMVDALGPVLMANRSPVLHYPRY